MIYICVCGLFIFSRNLLQIMKTTFQISITFLCLSLLLGLTNCSLKTTQNQSTKLEPKIYNVNSEEKKVYVKSLNLDEQYKNLVSNEETDTVYINKVFNEFAEFSYELGDFLMEKEFDWGIEDSIAYVFIRGYFNSEGEVEHLIYRVKSADVPEENIEKLGEVMLPFFKEHGMKIEGKSQYTQCGTVPFYTR